MKRVDIIEAQEMATSAANMAEKMVKKYGGDISAIKKNLKKRDRFEREVLWAAKWLVGIHSR